MANPDDPNAVPWWEMGNGAALNAPAGGDVNTIQPVGPPIPLEPDLNTIQQPAAPDVSRKQPGTNTNENPIQGPGPVDSPPPPPAPAPQAPVEDLVRPYAPAQGGLQLVGFDPKAHMGETPTTTAPKYAVANVIQQLSKQPGFDPLNYAQTAADHLNKMFGTTQFKASDGQTLLYGDEYVHTAPAGYGGGDPNGGQELFWGYTGGQGGPGGGGGGKTTSGGAGAPPPSSSQYGGPGGPGVFDPTNLQQVGQDPFSLLIMSKLGEMIGNNGHLDSNSEALNLENARGVADRARKAEMSGLDAQLANRGVLDQFDPAGGAHAATASAVERNDIAPLYSDAVRNYLIDNNHQANDNLKFALSEGTNRQNVLSQIALQTLSQNTAFNEFLATFGLERDKVLYELANGQNGSLLALLTQFLSASQGTQKGYV